MFHKMRNFFLRSTKSSATDPMLQKDAQEGVAWVLKTMLSYWGKNLSLLELKDLCCVERLDTRDLHFREFAETLGFEVHTLYKPGSFLKTLSCPFIVSYKEGVLCIVENIQKDGKVRLNHPKEGVLEISFHLFEKDYQGLCYLLSQSDDNKLIGEKKTSLWFFVKNHLKRMKGIGSSIFFSAFSLFFVHLFFIFILRFFIDECVFNFRKSGALIIFGSLLVAGVLYSCLIYMQGLLLSRLQSKLTIDASCQLLWRFLRFPTTIYQQKNPKDFVHMLGDVQQTFSLLCSSLLRVFAALTVGVFYLAWLYLYQPQLAYLSFTLLLVTGSLCGVLWKNFEVLEVQKDQARNNVDEDARSLSEQSTSLKYACAEDAFFSRWGGSFSRYLDFFFRSYDLRNLYSFLSSFLLPFAFLLVLALGFSSIFLGKITPGEFFAMQVLVYLLLEPFQEAMMSLETLAFFKKKLMSIYELKNIDLDPLLSDEGSLASHTLYFEGNIKVEGLSFSYHHLLEPVLRDVSFNLEAGKTLGIVGPSAAGKTTLLKLILGLQAPSSGRILFDGSSRKDFSRQHLSHSIGVCFQEPQLICGTLEENLLLWNKQASNAQMMQAAKDAHIHKDILSRQGGYLGFVASNGENLSYSERFRIELARALLLNPRVLIIDSCLDCLDESMQKTLVGRLQERKISLIILSYSEYILPFCHEILVLNKQLIAQGTMETLYQECPLYRKLTMAS